METDEHGRARLDLEPAAWAVAHVHAPGRAARWMAPVTWGDLDDRDRTFALGEGRAAKGRITCASGGAAANLRVRFLPVWPTGDFATIVASKLDIVDEEITTDGDGSFSCSSLRPGDYRLSFPDHPKWPALVVRDRELTAGPLALRLPVEK